MADSRSTNVQGAKVIYSSKWVAGGIAAFWVHLPLSVQGLLILSAADYLTGALLALKEGRWCAQQGRDGLVEKAMMFILVYCVGIMTGILHIPFDTGSAIAIAFCVNELSSVVRNCAEHGVAIPKPLVDFLKKAKNLVGND